MDVCRTSGLRPGLAQPSEHADHAEALPLPGGSGSGAPLASSALPSAAASSCCALVACPRRDWGQGSG